MNLHPLQQMAVDAAVKNAVSIITGGPGTGKTTVCKQIIVRLIESGMSENDIALCAPTGKAARRLSEQTQMEASTIHRLLAYNPVYECFTHCASNPLHCKAFIVDECSMVDTYLMACLLNAVRDDAKVILVGDVDQLPSVGPGSVLRDLISSRVIPTVRLTHIFRQSEHSWISENARRVLDGKMPERDRHSEDFFWIERESSESTAQAVVDLMTTIPDTHQIKSSDIQVLCPQRTTLIGVNELNKRLQQTLNPQRENETEWLFSNGVLRVGDRVMHVKNNYMIGVMNGEIGTVKIIENYSRLFVDYEDRLLAYGIENSNQLQLCYATTIHKSQGSEYPCVIVVVHSSNTFMLSRSLLYTAITRGKQFVYLVGNLKGIKRAVKNNESAGRYTSLQQRLIAELHV